ncbi:hypothetical protein [Stratiformator vulcanicus]|uniref:Uncharacterized protein n=1 Tax=Stratiformator vulcanicus TaxID=2527980 RepID=A0A517QYX0_9PLAN|nr:hypothetical protein [Stratiformator vulcanicus]QDT36832.1 hypothetical protein Pan189_11950 [Stratiformator vulcanicus]
MPTWAKSYLLCGAIGFAVGLVWVAISLTVERAFESEFNWHCVFAVFAGAAVFGSGLPFLRRDGVCISRLLVATLLALPVGAVWYEFVKDWSDYFDEIGTVGGTVAVMLCGAVVGFCHGFLTLLAVADYRVGDEYRPHLRQWGVAMLFFIIAGALAAAYVSTAFVLALYLSLYIMEELMIGIIYGAIALVGVIGSLPVGYLRIAVLNQRERESVTSPNGNVASSR